MSKLILLCAPSGTGKTSIARMLCATDSRFHHVPVFTSRAIRPNEDGREEKIHASFDDLLLMNNNGELVNFNEKDGIYYGIRNYSIETTILEGKFPILEWDINNIYFWDDKFPVFKVVLKPSSVEHILNSLRDGRDASGIRKNGVLRELELIETGRLKSDLIVLNRDAAIMDTVQKIRSGIFHNF